MICTIAKKTSDGKDAYGFLLRADHDGYLYTDEDKVNPVGQLKEGGWTKIGLILTGNGEKWTNLQILINDELVESSPKTFTAAVESCKFRFTNMASTVIGYDDISIRPYVAPPAEPEPLKIGFENGEETDNAILDLSGDWQYGKLDATRVDADGNTVTVDKTCYGYSHKIVYTVSNGNVTDGGMVKHDGTVISDANVYASQKYLVAYGNGDKTTIEFRRYLASFTSAKPETVEYFISVKYNGDTLYFPRVQTNASTATFRPDFTFWPAVADLDSNHLDHQQDMETISRLTP
jgi:hypothetical protein